MYSRFFLLLLTIPSCSIVGIAFATQSDIHYHGSIDLENSMYHRGDTVSFHGWSNAYQDWKAGFTPVSNGLFDVNILGPDNNLVFEKNFTADGNGNIKFTLPITNDFKFGKYIVNFTLSKNGYDTYQFDQLRTFNVVRTASDIVHATGFDFKLWPESSEIKYQSYPKLNFSICPSLSKTMTNESFVDSDTGIEVNPGYGLLTYHFTKPDGTKTTLDPYGQILHMWFDHNTCPSENTNVFYANMGGNWTAYAVAKWVSNGIMYQMQSNTTSFHVAEPQFSSQITKIVNMTKLGRGLDIDQDNKFVIFTTLTGNDKGQDTNTLWTVHEDGTGLQQIDTGKDFEQITSPKISPSGKMILWSGAYYDGDVPVYGLFVYDIKEGKLVSISHGSQSSDSIGEFHWTHDNDVVYVAKKWNDKTHTLSTSIVIADAIGKTMNTTSTDLSQLDLYRDPDNLGPISVSVEGYQYSGGGAVSINAVDGFEEKIFEIPNGASYPTSATISSDGKSIVFGYVGDGIYVAKLDKSVTGYHLVLPTKTTGPVTIHLQNVTLPRQSSVKFENPINLSNDGKSQNAQIAASGNNIYAVWEDSTPGNLEIYFKKSSDGGKTFGNKINLSNTDGRSYDPQILASGNNVYIVWSDETKLTEANTNVLFAKSTDGGQTFSKPVNLSQDNAYSSATINWYPHLISSGNNIYVMWIVSNYNWVNVFVAKSPDNGDSFGKPVNISNSNTQDIVQLPEITSSGKNVYVIWQDYFNNSHDPAYGYIKLAKSNNDGNSFDVQKLSDNNGTKGLSSTEPHVYARGDNVYALWRDEIQEHGITLAKSTDTGNAFHKTYLAETGSLASESPWKIDKNENHYVIWDDWKDIFFTKSQNGLTFSSPINLSNNTWSLNPYDEIPRPQLAISGDNVFVVWKYTVSPDGNHAPFFISSDDGGRTFSYPIKLSQSAGDSEEDPRIETSGNSLYVSYSDTIPAGSDIFLVKGTFQGSADSTISSTDDYNSNNIFEQFLNWIKQIFHFMLIGMFQMNSVF